MKGYSYILVHQGRMEKAPSQIIKMWPQENHHVPERVCDPPPQFLFSHVFREEHAP